MLLIPGYEIFETIYSRNAKNVYRARNKQTGLSVVVKSKENILAGYETLDQIKSEYETLQKLEHPNIIKTHDIILGDENNFLILEDFNALSLRQLIDKRNLTLIQFLHVIIQICSGLEYLRSRGVIHMDIHPGNILFNPEDLRVKICDFGQTMWILEATQDNHTAGTLHYAPPEQTGRINYEIDERSNLYSLGVIMYEYLGGDLPFNDNDLLSLVHAIIARNPLPLQKRPLFIQSGHPEILSDIVMKLLSKYPEHRYQGALALKYDLEKLKSLVEKEPKRAHPFRFKLAQKDFSKTLRIPQSLISRQPEYQVLTDAFDASLNGKTQFIYVKGEAGSGKTFLVNNLQKKSF